MPILKQMLPAPSDDNNAKNLVLKTVAGMAATSGSYTDIASYLRTMKLIIVWVVCILSAVLYPGTAAAAGAAMEEPVPAGLPAVAPEVRTEGSVPAAPLPQEEKKGSAPSTSGQPLTVPTATSPTAPASSPVPAYEYTGVVDTLHEGLSRGLLTSAVWLDSFFGDERYEAEINRSQFRVRLEAFREGSGGMEYLRPNFDLRLVLPQLRKKTRLVISGDQHVDADATSAQQGGAATTAAKDAERNLTTSLQVVPVETDRSNFSIRAGVKLHNGEVSVLAGPRYRYLIPLDPWALRFTQEVTWSSDMRWQSRTRFDIERPLPPDLFFRTSLEGVWSENVFGYPYSLSFVLRQPLDGNRALQYEWINRFQTWPTDLLIEELLVFRYRQRFWRDWLFLEIAPQIRFPRDTGFEYTPGILFKLEMVFGDIRNIF